MPSCSVTLRQLLVLRRRRPARYRRPTAPHWYSMPCWDMLLRAALNVLHERELKQGGYITRGAIECALMATNRYLAEVLEQSRETPLALVDRIVYLSFVPKGFATPESLGRVLKTQVGISEHAKPKALLTIQDLDALQALTESVHISDSMCDRLVQLVHSVEQELHQASQADPSVWCLAEGSMSRTASVLASARSESPNPNRAGRWAPTA